MSDVIEFGGPGRRPSRRPITIAVALVAVAAAAVAVVATHDAGRRTAAPGPSALPTPTVVATDEPTVPTTSGTDSPPGPTADGCPEITMDGRRTPAGLAITGAPTGSALERCDQTAFEGAWAVTLRRPDGALGRHGAVVVYPVPAPASGRPIATDRAAVQPAEGGWVRIRGDLGRAELEAILRRTTIVHGEPAPATPGDLGVVAAGPYAPMAVHEMRYGANDVGEAAALGNGLVFTGVSASGGFEDQLYAGSPTWVHVRGQTGVVSTDLGGNGAVVWEPGPGLIAYVGYSGAQLTDAAVAALVRLAERTIDISPAQWAGLNPSVS